MQLFKSFFFCLMALTQAWGMQDSSSYGEGREGLLKIGKNQVGRDQLYQLDMERLSCIEPILCDLPPSFKGYTHSLMGGDKELYREKVNIDEGILREVRKFCFQIREPEVELKISGLKTLSEIQGLMLDHFKIYFPKEIEGKILELEKGIAEVKCTALTYAEQYDEFVSIYGIKRDMPFKFFIDDLINVKREERDPLIQKEANAVVKDLIRLGFIQTCYPLAKSFVYEPGVLVEAYMEKYPEVNRLILGCGHHLYSGVTDFFGVPREGFCSECNLTPFHHGDLTISLLRNDFSDVIGDMNDERIWDALKRRSWKLIGDHSWAASFERRETLQAIYDSLAEDGMFEVWVLPDSYIGRALDVGFQLFEINKEKNVAYFKKGG